MVRRRINLRRGSPKATKESDLFVSTFSSALSMQPISRIRRSLSWIFWSIMVFCPMIIGASLVVWSCLQPIVKTALGH